MQQNCCLENHLEKLLSIKLSGVFCVFVLFCCFVGLVFFNASRSPPTH